MKVPVGNMLQNGDEYASFCTMTEFYGFVNNFQPLMPHSIGGYFLRLKGVTGMGIIQSKVTPEFKKWVGYCEKNSAAEIGTYDKPENYTKNAGKKNYTVFAKLYKQNYISCI